ncbi:MAG TPA: Flp family type IVb pilin [Verrucomicrobiae bacterium]|nr:Flp family type IVb pilin [Verrucomicrobiae bacterium]
MKAFFIEFLRDDQGQDLVEYTLLLSFVLFAVVGLAVGYNASIAGVTSTTNQNLQLANGATH